MIRKQSRGSVLRGSVLRGLVTRGWVLRRSMLSAAIGCCLVAVTLAESRTPVSAGAMPALLISLGNRIVTVEPDSKSLDGKSSDSKSVDSKSVDSKSKVRFDRIGLSNFDGSFVVTTRVANRKTSINVWNPWTGVLVWKTERVGTWRAQAISNDGTQVVLGDPNVSPTIYDVPSGRTTTSFLFIERGQPERAVNVEGNLVAEAFQADGGAVALIDYIPPLAPRQYRIRPYGFDVGVEGSPVGGRKTVSQPEVMEGVRINHSWDATGRALYTLYDASKYSDSEGVPEGVFVHALNLENSTARCLDVPKEIDAGEGKGRVVSLPNGKLIVVGRQGMVRIDSLSGRVEQVVHTPMKKTSALFGNGQRFFVGSGRTLTEYAIADLIRLSERTMTNEIASGTLFDYLPPIVVDVSGKIWYVTDSPILRGQLPFTPSAGSELRARPA